MILSFLIALKTILFLSITRVEFNKIIILLITFMTTMLIVSLIKQTKLKHKNKLILTFYSAISIIMFIDVVHYAHFSSLPTISMLSQTKQLGAVKDSIKDLLNLRNLMIILDIPILIFFYSYLDKKIEKVTEKYISKRKLSYITFTILVLSLVYTATMGQLESVVAQELYLYHVSDIKDSFNLSKAEANSIFTEEDLEEIKNRTNLDDGQLTGIGKDKNLIVLQIEALQDFVIDLKYEGQEITPNLNKLIKEQSSIYYDNYHQLVGRGNTADAEFVSQNSFHPSMEEPSYTKYENNTFYGLPLLLKDNGYTPWVMHGYKKEFWNRENAYVNQGFERFISEEDYKVEDIIGFGLKDEDFFNQNIEYLKELDKKDDNPFYAFMITLTSHTPFDMPQEKKVLDILPKHKDNIIGDYLQSIHYTDQQIGIFIEDLKKEGLYDDSVIAIYGDHFAISSMHDAEQEMMSELLGYEYSFNDMMNIPLIVHVPGKEINQRISTLGSQIDFYPTILNIMGYKNEKGLMLGRDLTNYKEGNYIAPQTYMLKGSFIQGDNMFVVARDGIFDHSSAYSIRTKEEIDIQQFRPMYENVIEEINKSDFILKNNLLKNYIENDGNVDLNNLTPAYESNDGYIAQASYNSLEELNQYYSKGYRLIAVDLEQTRDEKIVLLNDWDNIYKDLFNSTIAHPNIEEFKSVKMKNGNTQMSLEDLVEWMEDHKDVQILLRSKDLDGKIIIQAKNEYPVLIENGIAEITDFQHYSATTFNGFRKVMLNPTLKDYQDDEIIDFINIHPHTGVILDKERANTNLPKRLEQKFVPTYVEHPTGRFARMLLKRKVKGFIVNPMKEDNIHLETSKIVQNKNIVAHAGGQLQGQTYSNSVESLNNSYKNGIRLMEIDLEWTTDKELVVLHSWDGFLTKFFNVPVKQYSFEEFKNFKMINGWHQMTPKVLDRWFAYHSDAYLVTDIKTNNVEGLKKIKEEFPRLIDQTIPQIYHLNEYEKVKNLGYNNIILTLYLIGSTDDEIVEFAKNNELFAVTMPIKKAKTDLARRLKAEGIYVYAHTVNSPSLAEELKEIGVSGFYSDIPE